jgi:hypothetical protein
VQTVRIRKQKRPTGQMIWRAYVFTADQFGTWLYSPEGTLVRGEKDGVIAFNEVGRGNRDRGAHCIHLVPPGGWWFAIWADDGHARSVAIDVCVPPSFDGEGWRFTDLELDLYKSGQGEARVDDEDEFADAVREGLISQSERTAALAAASELGRRLAGYDRLFDGIGWRHLAAAIQLSLPPLRNLP